MNVETIVKSFPHENNEVIVEFLGKHDISELHYSRSDLIIYTGATDGIYSLSIPEINRLRSHSKIIFISTAGGDINWHPLLKQYADDDVFDLVVNIDGFKDWPKRPRDLTLLGCVDPAPYEVNSEKDIILGCNFGKHPARNAFTDGLGNLCTHGIRSESYGTNSKYSDFIKRCKFFLNVNWTSQDEIIRHVNMKVIEAGLAGCILLEKNGSWVNKWFKPGLDYFEYETAEDVLEIINRPDWIKRIAISLSKQVKNEYSNIQFWSKVFKAL